MWSLAKRGVSFEACLLAVLNAVNGLVGQAANPGEGLAAGWARHLQREYTLGRGTGADTSSMWSRTLLRYMAACSSQQQCRRGPVQHHRCRRHRCRSRRRWWSSQGRCAAGWKATSCTCRMHHRGLSSETEAAGNGPATN